ncbi:hexokinase family protein [Psychromonas ossibalaenae]|uniref:hexokinase family protein n=1 Tax=Psychromonas ossibalaenae TaxID=444922 RepID=UPI00037AA11F|nr:hypothetical protein [Psychromonas ossibalaenae]
MLVTKSKVDSFLKKNEMSASGIDADAMLDDFCSEMRDGLAGNDSSLAMIASYVSADSSVPANKPVIVLDAGGTNLRVCTASFDEHGRVDIEHFKKYQMPGIAHELSREEFYTALCDYLEPVINKSDSIGFCFSYPTEISPEKDGKLLCWTKEVKVPEVVGEYIGAGLLEALAERGHKGKKLVLLNDTVAALLAGKAVGEQRRCDGYIGFILGTGTNTAYVESNRNIDKIESVDGAQVINVESGNFNKCPQGIIDKQFDASTANPGAYIFEKMISGRYLGEVALEGIKQAAKDGLFSESAAAEISALNCLETADLSLFLENPFNVVAPFCSDAILEADREILYYLVLDLIDRSAKLTAVNIAAAVVKGDAGRSPLYPVCINVDGSTYHKLHGLRAKCEAYLSDLLNSRGYYFKTIEVENAPVIGSAIAGLVG